MQGSKIGLLLGFLSISIFIGCSKDKNMDDFRREQLHESLSRITAISGAYSGPVISKIDGSNLGLIVLKFKANTDIQSSSGRVVTDQVASVSGSINLQSVTTNEVTFDNGYYDDVTGNFQVTIPIGLSGQADARLYLAGNISGNRWIGSLEVNGQPQYGADLNLQKNAPIGNTSSIEIGGTRLEQIKRLDFRYEGSYKVDNTISALKLSFTNRDVSPNQNLYKLFSPVRLVNLNCDFSGFELNFSNANLDDTLGTLIANDPTDQQGRPARASLNCKRFELESNFGWDCEILTRTVVLRTRLSAVR